MGEITHSSFVSFNEETKDRNGRTACMIVRLEEMNPTNEEIAAIREILSEAAEKMRMRLGL